MAPSSSKTPLVRRIAISFGAGCLIALVAHAVLAVVYAVDELYLHWNLVERLLAALKDIPKLNEVIAFVWPWGLREAALVVLGTGALFYPLSGRVDFVLFSPPDFDLFHPIRRHTGYLQWHAGAPGAIAEAFASLEGRVRAGVGEPRWKPRWLVRKPTLEQPFAWNLLLGGNGTGKSQMARELGRKLGRRDELGDAPQYGREAAVRASRGQRLRFWYLRVAPWREAAEIPWDAGVLERRGADLAGRLARFRPRAPTLLILDDPGPDDSKRAIEALTMAADEFWFPVRLLIVDQFMPPDLPIVARGDGGWAHEGREHEGEAGRFEPVLHGATGMSLAEMRGALSRGYWSDEDTLKPCDGLPALNVPEEQLVRLLEAIEGSPLLLALAVRWFAVDRVRDIDRLLEVDSLSEEERALFQGSGVAKLVAHRLITDRIAELARAFASREDRHRIKSGQLQLAVACAAIADGLPLEDALRAFDLALDEGALAALFLELSPLDAPRAGGPAVRMLPPLRPWLIAEAFFQHVERAILHRNVARGDDPAEGNALIRRAFELHPEGVLKAILRRGPLARRIDAALEGAELPESGAGLLRWFEAYALLALYDHADAEHWRAKLMAVLDRLQGDVERTARARVPLLLARPYPDPVSALALFCHFEGRALAHSKDPAGDRARIEQFVRMQVDNYPDLMTLSELQSARLNVFWSRYLRSILEQSSVEEAFEGLKAGWYAFLSGLDGACVSLLVDESRRARLSHPVLAGAWLDVCLPLPPVNRLDVAQYMRDAKALENAAWPLPTQITIELRIWAWRHVARACLFASEARGALAAAEAATAIARRHDALSGNAGLHQTLQWVWNHAMCALAQDATERGATDGIVERVEAMLGGDGAFSAHTGVRAARAWFWTYAVVGWSAESAARSKTQEAVARVESIVCSSPAFARDTACQAARAWAWMRQAYAYRHEPAMSARVEEAALCVERIAAALPELTSHIEIQASRSAAWATVAAACACDPAARAKAEEAARRVEQIASISPVFARSDQIQFNRADAWRWVANACEDDAEKAEQAARRVDRIAAAYKTPDALELRVSRAWAWANVAQARAKSSLARAHTAEAAQRVDAIAAGESSSPPMQEARLWARVYLAFAGSQDVTLDVDTEALADQIETIISATPVLAEALETQVARAAVALHLASARARDPARRHLVEDAAHKIELIASDPRFGNDDRVQHCLKALGDLRARLAIQEAPQLSGA